MKDGRTCLGLEFFVWEGDHMWTKADDDLVEQGKRELHEIGLLGDPTRVEAGYVVRMPKAYPMYDDDYKENVAVPRGSGSTSNTPNVYPVGRNGMHRYNNQDHSMFTAMLSVENIFGADHDVWDVNVDEEYHEEKAAAAPPHPNQYAAPPLLPWKQGVRGPAPPRPVSRGAAACAIRRRCGRRRSSPRCARRRAPRCRHRHLGEPDRLEDVLVERHPGDVADDVTTSSVSTNWM